METLTRESRSQRFVKARLLAHTKTQLGKYSLRVEDRGGIGSAFLLTNPRLRDDPIVLVSPGFEQLTGYSAQQIVGRNCRYVVMLVVASYSAGLGCRPESFSFFRLTFSICNVALILLDPLAQLPSRQGDVSGGRRQHSQAPRGGRRGHAARAQLCVLFVSCLPDA